MSHQEERDTMDSMTRITSLDGIEIWRTLVDGAEQFVVRLGARRARLVSSLASAHTLLALEVQRRRVARAH